MTKRADGGVALGPAMVHWLDAATAGPGWEDLSAAEPLVPLECWSVGMLFSEDDESVVLLQTVTNDGAAQGRMVIPRGSVVSVKRLSPGRRKRRRGKGV